MQKASVCRLFSLLQRDVRMCSEECGSGQQCGLFGSGSLVGSAGEDMKITTSSW